MSDTPEHRSAVQQLAKTRMRALESIHIVRSEHPGSANKNLVKINQRRNNRGDPHPVAEATACVVDYLTHLKPHAVNAEAWNTSLGVVEIPETIEGSSAGLKRGSSGQYRCTRMPYLNINDMGAAIRAGNTEIAYAGGGGEVEFTPKNEQRNGPTHHVNGHALTTRGIRQFRTGTDIRECEHQEQPPMPRNGVVYAGINRDFQPASRSDDEEKFQFVYTLGQLMSLYEIADTLATQADLLADIKTQDATDQTGF